MLIINADDFGFAESETQRTIECYKKGRISSASAMVFAPDSERAARLALENGLPVGLHLNFTTVLEGRHESSQLEQCEERVAAFLLKGRYSEVLYSFSLRSCFGSIFAAQLREFLRLYGRMPTHFDGHHHMHLCANVLMDQLIQRGSRVRRSFTIQRGEKSLVNRLYRCMVDALLTRRYRCTDYFFSINPLGHPGRLQGLVELAASSTVEVEVHPGRVEEYEYLMGDEYARAIDGATRGSYADL